MGGEDVDLGGEVELAVTVQGDVFDEGAGAGEFSRSGAVDALAAVVGGQGMDQSVLSEAWVPSMARTTQSRTGMGLPGAR